MADAMRADYEDTRQIPSWLKPPLKREYSYKDYKNWEEDIRVELFDGMVYMMASPGEWHQWVMTELWKQLDNILAGKKCTPYVAPLDVRLFYEEDETDTTVVQPDIMVVCDESKTLGLKYCKGAPNFIIEILSDSSGGRDLIDKKIQYEKAGVQEYWVVSRENVYKYVLINGVYLEKIFPINRELQLKIDTLENCVIDFRAITDRYT